jgi:hypothetical protein
MTISGLLEKTSITNLDIVNLVYLHCDLCGKKNEHKECQEKHKGHKEE